MMTAQKSTGRLLSATSWCNPGSLPENEWLKTNGKQQQMLLDSANFNAIRLPDKIPTSSFHDSWVPKENYWELFPIDQAVLNLDRESKLPSVDNFIHILQMCRRSRSLEYARQLYFHAQRGGLVFHKDVGNHLVPMLVECGNMLDAQHVFDCLPSRNVYAWTSLISGYVEFGQQQYALSLYQKMHDDNVYPSSYTFVALLKACIAVEDAQGIHVEVVEKGFETDIFVGSSLIDVYARYGAMLNARAVFNKLPDRNVVSWTALIAGYAENGPCSEALRCFEEMKFQGITPNSVTYMCVLKACGKTKNLNNARILQSEIVQKGVEGDCNVGSSLVDMYVKCGSMEEAHKTFDKLLSRDIVSWNTLIAGYAELGPGQKALKCLQKMESEGIFLDPVTFAYALKVCGSMGAIENGWELHFLLICMGLEVDSFIGSTLVDMYAKCGLVLDSQKVFDKLLVRDVVSWNAIIKGYSMNHEGETAIQYFEDMKEEGVKPDAVTFTCVLAACSHARLAIKGREMFKEMTNVYGIIPTIDHFNCMVDMLSRTGRINEAIKFMESMPCSPSSDMWTALLTACRSFAEVDAGFQCYQQLVKIDSEWAVPYVLMSEIYTNAGRFDDAYRIEKLRKKAKAKKKPACALIEVNKEVHEFVVGQNENGEVSAMLDRLNARMGKEGYMPNLDFVMGLLSDDAKETALCDHAEKLAIAFGLLNTAPGDTLRVTKNMRMCNDCHSRAKAISKMERREIIVREIYQVHRFKDGFCSCGDKC